MGASGVAEAAGAEAHGKHEEDQQARADLLPVEVPAE